MTTEDLANFQSTLLEILAVPADSTALLTRLQQAKFSHPWADYIASFDPPMVEVAAELVQKWGKR